MSSSGPTAPPGPPVVLGTGNNILINPLQVKQRGNTVLDNIKNVGKEFGDIVADYQVGRTTGVLFLSLKYHRLHPEYIHIRIEKLGHSYTLRILLVLCDIVCLINNVTILVAFSFEEAGHYLSTLKQFEHRPPDMIKERVDKDYDSVLRTALTSISKVNKTDVETLRTSFGSFANIARATPDQLRDLPGFGQVKVKNIKNTFDKPLRNNATRTLSPTRATSQDSSEAIAEPLELSIVASSKASTKGKGKETARPPREPSPVWDIEYDNLAENGPLPDFPPQPFDIDLDLN
ncbi:hypothetical protein DXG01_003852 [Tephrocybe rancida]|nr:hypothetical protein DXG01_003852 [Tephrocybe rancida]